MTTSEINRIASSVAQRMKAEYEIAFDTLMNVRQCAAYMGITEEALRTRCTRNLIPFHKKNGNIYFSRKEINEYHLS